MKRRVLRPDLEVAEPADYREGGYRPLLRRRPDYAAAPGARVGVLTLPGA